MQRFVGRVVSTAMDKTCTVLVEKVIPVPKNPNKVLHRTKKYLIHDEHNLTVPGDIVSLEYYGKISSKKSFILKEILKGARSWVDPKTGQVYTHC